MATGDLTTLENVKQYMQIPDADTSNDTVLARLISAFSAWFINQINRSSLLSATYTEQRNGQGGDSITLRNFPVTAVASVIVDGISIPPSDGIVPGFIFDQFTIWLKGYRFNRGRGNVNLSYTAGYETVPPDVEQAVIDQVAFTSRRQPNLGTVSQSANGILTTAFSQNDLAPGVKAVINNFKDYTVVGI